MGPARALPPRQTRHLRAVTTVREPCPRRKTNSHQVPVPPPTHRHPTQEPRHPLIYGALGHPVPERAAPWPWPVGPASGGSCPPLPRRAMFTRHGVPKRRPAVAYFVVLGPVSPPPPFYKRRFFPQRPSNQARRRPPPLRRSLLCLPPSALR